jgi:DNA polymerase-3 subunit delta'
MSVSAATSKIVLNPATQKQVEAFLMSPKHALGITGDTGVGKGTLATYIASQILDLEPGKLERHPYFKRFEPKKDTISVEQAREIAAFMRLKTTGDTEIRRVVVVEHANTMTIEAQNALLKTIEEPPADTVLILTLPTSRSVLPTIASRLQTISVHAPETELLIIHLEELGFASDMIERSVRISSGLPGLAVALLSEQSEHQLVAAISLAKKVLQADTFERLIMIDDIVKNKQVDNLLSALSFTAQAALEVSAAKDANAKVLRKWADIQKFTLQAREQAAQNAQSKLLLTNLFLNL